MLVNGDIISFQHYVL